MQAKKANYFVIVFLFKKGLQKEICFRTTKKYDKVFTSFLRKFLCFSLFGDFLFLDTGRLRWDMSIENEYKIDYKTTELVENFVNCVSLENIKEIFI